MTHACGGARFFSQTFEMTRARSLLPGSGRPLFTRTSTSAKKTTGPNGWGRPPRGRNLDVPVDSTGCTGFEDGPVHAWRTLRRFFRLSVNRLADEPTVASTDTSNEEEDTGRITPITEPSPPTTRRRGTTP
jgi:hypothetical protein